MRFGCFPDRAKSQKKRHISKEVLSPKKEEGKPEGFPYENQIVYSLLEAELPASRTRCTEEAGTEQDERRRFRRHRGGRDGLVTEAAACSSILDGDGATGVFGGIGLDNQVVTMVAGGDGVIREEVEANYTTRSAAVNADRSQAARVREIAHVQHETVKVKTGDTLDDTAGADVGDVDAEIEAARAERVSGVGEDAGSILGGKGSRRDRAADGGRDLGEICCGGTDRSCGNLRSRIDRCSEGRDTCNDGQGERGGQLCVHKNSREETFTALAAE